MSDGEVPVLGETGTLGDLEIVVERPAENLPTTASISDACLQLDGDSVRGYTGLGMSLVRITARNVGSSPVDVGRIDLRLTDRSHFDRDAAEESDFTYRGEPRTSFLRVLMGGEQLAPDDEISGLVTHTSIPFRDPDPGRLVLKMRGSDADEPRRAEWLLTTNGDGDTSSVERTPDDSDAFEPEPPGDDHDDANDVTFCTHCGTELTRYDDVQYCPACGEQRSIVHSSGEDEPGDSDYGLCANCYVSLSGYGDLEFCPSCGLRPLADAEKTEAATILGKIAFDDITNSIRLDELVTIVELLDSADQQFRFYAVQALSTVNCGMDVSGSSKRSEEVLIEALPTLIDLLDSASYDDSFGGGTAGHVPKVSGVSAAITNVLETITSGVHRPNRGELRGDRLVKIATKQLQKTIELETQNYPSDETQIHLQSHLIDLLSVLVRIDPDLLTKQALEQTSHVLENVLVGDLDLATNTGSAVEPSNQCPVCEMKWGITPQECILSCVNILTPFAESRPTIVERIAPTVLNALEEPYGSGLINGKLIELLLPIAESSPEPFVTNLETLTQLASYGMLPIEPESTAIQPTTSTVRENVATILAMLIVDRQIDASVVVDGLESDDEVYVETMVQAVERVASRDPEVVEDAGTSLLPLVDDDFHYSIRAAAAGAIGHLGMSSACELLLELYFEAESYDLGADRIIRESVAKALHKLDGAQIVTDDEDHDWRVSNIYCLHCTEPLDTYDAPLFCPNCGISICTE